MAARASVFIATSQNPISFPDVLPKCVSHSSEPPEDLHRRLSNEGASHLYIDGGVTIRSFLLAGLIDEITITVIPVLLGSGISLFGPITEDLWLTHRSTTAYDFGFVQSTYDVVASGKSR